MGKLPSDAYIQTNKKSLFVILIQHDDMGSKPYNGVKINKSVNKN